MISQATTNPGTPLLADLARKTMRAQLHKVSWEDDSASMTVDFRSELGRYFICECKNLKDNPADFTDFSKFCQVLDSIKSKFGIIFSPTGISGVL